MTRKEFIGGAAGALTAGSTTSLAAQDKETVTLENRQFRLTLSLAAGLESRLIHSPSGLTLADGRYSYSFGAPPFSKAIQRKDGSTSVAALEAVTPEGLHVTQEYRVSGERPWIEERIALSNSTSHPLALTYARCGFVLPLHRQDGAVSGPLGRFRCIAVPYRREPNGNRQQYADYTIQQVLTEPRRSLLRADAPTLRTGNVVQPKGLEKGGLPICRRLPIRPTRPPLREGFGRCLLLKPSASRPYSGNLYEADLAGGEAVQATPPATPTWCLTILWA
jgi:hypothetical protein